jgi:hypothetical protein
LLSDLVNSQIQLRTRSNGEKNAFLLLVLAIFVQISSKQSKSLQFNALLNFFIIQAEKNVRGRLNKRPRANSSVLSPFDADFDAQSTNSPRKKT